MRAKDVVRISETALWRRVQEVKRINDADVDAREGE
jgi:hypothetical protein